MNANDTCAHCRESLPWYAVGTINSVERVSISRHLATCADCSHELTIWRALAQSVQTAASDAQPDLAFDVSWHQLRAALPPFQAARAVAMREETPARANVLESFVGVQGAPSARARLGLTFAAARHASNVLPAQMRLLRPVVWVASALGIALAAMYAGTLPRDTGERDVLTFALPLIGAAGMAFIYGPDNDPALELALGTPTSARTVLLSRFALLFTYDAVLAIVATALLVLIRGGEVWGLAMLWLGPMALLSTLGLVLSIFVNPVVAAGGALVVWLSRAIRMDEGPSVHFTATPLWHTTPQILALSLALLALAAFYAPRQEQLARDDQLF